MGNAMAPTRALVRWCGLLCLVAMFVSAALAQQRAVPPPAEGSAGEATFVGAKACASCHQEKHELWKSGRHSKMVQAASAASVKGDFGRRTVVLHGKRYQLSVVEDEYFITESYFTGIERRHRVDYTLGNRRIQHYLTTLADGKIIVLPPSWDVLRREWFHNKDIVNPDAVEPILQQWNKSCVGCHVSQQEVNYRSENDTYKTQWVDFGTSCERCHGPGSLHVEKFAVAAPNTGPGREGTERWIVKPTRLEPSRSSMICAQCHSARNKAAPGFKAGENYYDYFAPVLEYGVSAEDDTVYWPDGRPRRFSNDAIGLWQSECFLQGGATCTSCHYDPHKPDVDRNPQLAATNNALCTTCHESIGSSLTAHTRHRPDGPGSSCIECHMPKTVQSIKATMRDHTMSLPAPENTVAFGIPNACTECHEDKDPNWAAQAASKWWPENRRHKLVAQAEAFTAARARRPEGLDRLLRIADDGDAAPLIRANAVGYLEHYSDVRAAAALERAARSDHPAIRVAAVAGLGARAGRGGLAFRTLLFRALEDERRAVRIRALQSLVEHDLVTDGMGPANEARVRRVVREFAAWASQYQDDAGPQYDLGFLRLLMGEFDLAAEALENSLHLDSDRMSTKLLLGLARAGQGRVDAAKAILAEVPRSDSNYEAAQKLLLSLSQR